jgi:predicted transcriptional regulator
LSGERSKRAENEIVVSLLKSCIGKDVDKLTIMSKAFLSDAEASYYLSRLVGDGLLEYSVGLKKYRITLEGMKVAKHSE